MSKKTSTAGIFLGNILEHYDTAIYSFASPFLAPLFFPEISPLVALILAYAIIPLGMLVRPLGALFFGHIGDTRGRKKALTLSLAGMALVTGATGCLPLYSQIGAAAPLLLLVSRLLQSFFSEGEKMGGAIYLLEKNEEKKQDLISSLFGSSTIIGILLASFFITLLCYLDAMTACWRLLYFFGFLTALAALLLRRDLDIEKGEAGGRAAETISSRLRNFWRLRAATLPILLAAGFSYACYSMAFVLLIGFVPLITSVGKTEMMSLNTLFLFIDMATLPLFGYLAYRTSRHKVMYFSALAAALLAIPLTHLLSGATIGTVIIVRALFVLIGVAFSSVFHSWAQQLIPAEYRYSLISLSNSLGAQLFGGPTVALSLWLYKQSGIVSSVGWYWGLLALATAWAVARSALPVREKFIPASSILLTK